MSGGNLGSLLYGDVSMMSKKRSTEVDFIVDNSCDNSHLEISILRGNRNLSFLMCRL